MCLQVEARASLVRCRPAVEARGGAGLEACIALAGSSSSGKLPLAGGGVVSCSPLFVLGEGISHAYRPHPWVRRVAAGSGVSWLSLVAPS